MSNIKFYSVFALIFFVVLGLGYAVLMLSMSDPMLGTITFLSTLSSLSCFLLLGLGLAIPAVLLASILGWLQLALLLSGNIDPHLSREGFFTVLNTLFKKI
ncbi:hypothetical protein [Candidatus Berkiella aquae]|nr:hypothetical protein [Candidatus Berkiella aquae]MCS5710220.1 hypothetical protein [Candidatus Berkiella aquae]